MGWVARIDSEREKIIRELFTGENSLKLTFDYTSSIAVRSRALQLTVGTLGTREGMRLGCDVDWIGDDIVVGVTAMHVFIDGIKGIGTLTICGFTIGPQTLRPLLNSLSHSYISDCNKLPSFSLIVNYTNKHTLIATFNAL